MKLKKNTLKVTGSTGLNRFIGSNKFLGIVEMNNNWV